MPSVNISGGVKTSFEIARNFFQELDCTKHISSMPYHAYEMQPKAKKAYEEELDAEADLREAILRACDGFNVWALPNGRRGHSPIIRTRLSNTRESPA